MGIMDCDDEESWSGLKVCFDGLLYLIKCLLALTTVLCYEAFGSELFFVCFHTMAIIVVSDFLYSWKYNISRNLWFLRRGRIGT